MLTLEMRVRDYSIIKLDCVSKQVYGFVRKSWNEYYISASDYDGENQRKITSGPFRYYILGVFNGSLYFMNGNDRSPIKEMDVSKEIVIRSIAVDRNYYSDLVVVHNSLQPLGKS